MHPHTPQSHRAGPFEPPPRRVQRHYEPHECPEVLPLADRYDEWVTELGLPSANHYIATRYSDGKGCIGWHSDKDKDIAPKSLITVVKMGAHGRCFEMCLPGEEESPFFSKVLAPGTAVIMTLEANLATKHRVPVASDAGPSGSIVLRTITTVKSHADLAKELSKRRSDDAVATAAGSAGGAAQPMEVEAPPGPAPTEAPPLLVPRSALHGLGLDDLVSQFGHVLAAAPLDGPMAGRLLDSLVGLGLSGQEMQDSGAPPTTHMPSVPAHLHRAHPPAQLSTLTLSRPRAGACKHVNRLRKKQGASAPLKARAFELYTQWTSDGGAD